MRGLTFGVVCGLVFGIGQICLVVVVCGVIGSWFGGFLVCEFCGYFALVWCFACGLRFWGWHNTVYFGWFYCLGCYCCLRVLGVFGVFWVLLIGFGFADAVGFVGFSALRRIFVADGVYLWSRVGL